jgi:hypothetical protein
MPHGFFDRLREYYMAVARVLRGEADAASIFPNTTDVGMSRERSYAEFLRQHAPSKCNVFMGGFLFDDAGVESKQLDIIITTDTAPRFNLNNSDGTGKSFSPVEGTLGVVSVKSMLDRAGLFDALDGIASIPPTRSLEGRVNILLSIPVYEDWPVKVIFATRGVAPNTLLSHLNQYYLAHPDIPLYRRPDFIHVAGSCFIFRAKIGMSLHNPDTGVAESLVVGNFYMQTNDPDIQAIVWTLNQLQVNASASSHILFSYGGLLNRVGVSGA